MCKFMPMSWAIEDRARTGDIKTEPSAQASKNSKKDAFRTFRIAALSPPSPKTVRTKITQDSGDGVIPHA
jgi:hypothetical protein